ncbi:MAG: hypothetical protein AAFO61_00575 [Pseudomonadota bacterium]
MIINDVSQISVCHLVFIGKKVFLDQPAQATAAIAEITVQNRAPYLLRLLAIPDVIGILVFQHIARWEGQIGWAITQKGSPGKPGYKCGERAGAEFLAQITHRQIGFRHFFPR